MKVFTGRVISTKTKTATVVAERIIPHSLYRRRYKRAKKYQIHDEMGAKVGETVTFVASKPYSKFKKWKIVEIKRPTTDKPRSAAKNKVKSKKAVTDRSRVKNKKVI